jgi:hypothetical protein
VISTDEAEVNGLSIGLNAQLKEEDLLPGIIGNIEISLASKVKPYSPFEERKWVYLNKWSVGITLFYTSDPLIPVLNIGYSLRPERTAYDLTIDPADLFYLQPLVYFMANSEITLYSGFSLNSWSNAYQNGKIQDIEKRELIFNAGANFAFDKNLSAYVRFDISPSYPVLTIQITRQ